MQEAIDLYLELQNQPQNPARVALEPKGRLRKDEADELAAAVAAVRERWR